LLEVGPDREPAAHAFSADIHSVLPLPFRSKSWSARSFDDFWLTSRGSTSWFFRESVPTRLRLIITALLALVTIAGGGYIVRKASDDTGAEVRSALNLADHFIDAEVAIMRDRWYARGSTPPLFHLRELEDVRHLSVTFYGTDGPVVSVCQWPMFEGCR